MTMVAAPGHRQPLGRELPSADVAELAYAFGRLGFVIVRESLSSAEVKSIAAPLQSLSVSPREGKFAFLHLSELYLRLMTHPGVLALAEALTGRWFRFDNAFGLRMDPGSQARQGIHGGMFASQGAFWSGGATHRPQFSCIKVVFALTDVAEGDGGFVCIPGSHHLPRPSNISFTSTHRDCVNPALRAGDAVLFTETLLHGSRRWRGESARLALVYSYCPGHVSWRDPAFVRLPVEQSQLQPLERRLLRSPFVSDYADPDDNGSAWPRVRRSTTLTGAG